MASWAERVEALAMRVHGGDASAREELLKAGYQMVRTQIREHGWFRWDAEEDDLVQDGMLGFLEAVESFRPERTATFRGWAWFCVRRELVTSLIKSRRIKHTLMTDALRLDGPAYRHSRRGRELDGTAAPLLDRIQIHDDSRPSNDPLDLVIQDESNREAAELIETICSGMTPMQGEALYRVGWLGQTYREAGEAIGASVKSIDNAYQRARRRARKEWGWMAG